MAQYKFEKEAKVIVIDVLIENKGIKKKVKMVLDTGATYAMIPWEIAEALDLDPASCEKRVDIITASGTERTPLLTVDFISFIEKRAEKVNILVHDLPPKSYVDGLLGLSFLRNFNINLNFKEGILEIN